MIDRVRFVGEICGVGTSVGHRLVIGNWATSPFGAFADVMHQAPSGERTLFAPDATIADFVEATYVFDAVRLGAVEVERSPSRLRLTAPGLQIDVDLGPRTLLGWLLSAMPSRVAASSRWCSAIDPVASRLVDGVHTRGTAGNGRIEWYGATDQHEVTGVAGELDREPLGTLADVWPPVTFGFSSTPRRPALVSVTTTIQLAAPSAPGR